MTRLISSSIFKHCLLAACLLSHDDHTYVHNHNTHDKYNTGVDATSTAKLTSESKEKRPRSSKRRRRTKSIIDSGATIHCIKDQSLFTHIDMSKRVQLKVANNQVIESEGVGT